MLEVSLIEELKKLSYDVKIYRELIKDYTDDPYIKQTVDNLVECLDSRDINGILLFLERLKKWYELNINNIYSNMYVDNHNSHKIAFEQINTYYLSLSENLPSDIPDNIVESNSSLEIPVEGYNIFVSHSSKDEKICTAFVHLLEVLGVPERNILYSSSERLGIPADMEIFQYLRSRIVEKFNVYYMLSDNYYGSVYCLNEMGAAWVAQNEYSIYRLPNLTRSIDGVISSSKKAFRLDNPINLNQLRTKIAADFNSSISDNKWDEEKNKFLSILS